METSPARPRRLRACLALAAGALAVAACASSPSTQRVALDLVDAIDGLTEEQRQCMREKIEGYSNEELEVIGGDANGDGQVDDGEVVNVDFTDPASVASAPEAVRGFVDDLSTCTTAS